MVVANTSPILNGLTLVSGPSRGGKSRWAEHLVKQFKSVTYIATSPTRANDLNWEQRLEQHRNRRPKHWSVIESGPDLKKAIIQMPRSDVVLIEALGGFVTWHLDQPSSNWSALKNDLLQAIKQHDASILIVIEETGWGVVPSTSNGGLFRDRLGKLSQELEPLASNSWLVIQGRALNLKQLGIAVP